MFLLQCLHYDADRVSYLDALRWATEGSAKCLGTDDIGRIDNGICVELALFKLDELRFNSVGSLGRTVVMWCA